MERSTAARVLGVDVTASATEIRDAYRRRARNVHPDTSGGDAAAIVKLNAAYKTLVEQTAPDWHFASVPEAPTDVETSVADVAFADASDSSGGSSMLRWFGIALAVAGVVMTTVVFVAAVGYDWSLSP